jgi:tetratricopeptide (TPR) repeat protein
VGTLAQRFAQAVRHHQDGNFRQAEEIYSQILRIDPQHVDALHLLGLIAGQFGRHDLACAFILQALRLRPDFAEAHNNLGNELRSQNKLQEAVASYQQALRLKPSFAEAHNNLANALQEQGRSSEAVRHLRQAVSLSPNFALAHHNLGNVLLKLHRLQEAVASFQQVVRLQPNNAEAHNNLGLALRCLGRLDEAVASCQSALRLKPELAEAHVNLANAHHDQGRLEEAVAGYQEALRLKPELAEPYNNLGNALRHLGRLEEAVASYRQAVCVKPDYAEAHSNLGNALRVQGKLDEALASCQEATRLNPDLPQAHNNLGYVFQDMGIPEEALASYRQAISLKADFADAHNNLGAALLIQGQVNEALASIQEALRLAPDLPMAFHQLGRLARDGKYEMRVVEVEHIRRLLAEQGLSPKAKTLLHFTLAYVLEQQGDYDLAFEHYQQANAWKRRSSELHQPFDIQAHRHDVDQAIATFGRAFFARLAPLGHPSDAPVFIVGMPRSGTSLVEQILSSHPRFAGAGELLDIGNIRNELYTPEQYPTSLTGLTTQRAAALAERYLQRLLRGNPQSLRASDKMPQNYLHLGLIAVLFPRARVIHCRRDPRDTCVSCFCENFESIGFTSSLEDLGLYYREYERLMAHWRQVLPLSMFEVRYEELVANQEKLSRQLVDFCGLDWDDRCLRFHQTRRPVNTASNLQVRQPVYARSVGRWRRFERQLGPLLELLTPFLDQP